MRLLCALMFLFIPFNAQSALAENASARVFVPECNVYSEASFDSDVLFTLQKDDEVENVGQSGDFYEIEYDGQRGFVYKYYLCDAALTDQQTYPVFDAKIEKNCTVFNIADESEEVGTLKKGQQVYLYQGFNKKAKKIAVCYVDEDGRVNFGLVERTAVSPYGVSAGLITGIMVIISCVTILLLLLFMKKKKRGSKD